MAKSKATVAKSVTARKVKEIIVEIEDHQGALSEILGYLAEHGVNLLGYSALRLHQVGVLHLIPDNPARTLKLLGHTPAIKISAADIVYAVSRDKVGGGAAVTGKISDAGINIHYSYATSAGGNKYGSVFQTEDNAKTVRVLNR